jgi:hypothetical protein
MTDWDEFLTRLGARAGSAIVMLGVNSFEDLEELPSWQILRVPHVGRKSLREIEELMAEYGRTLADRARIQSTETDDLKRHQKRVAEKMRELATELKNLAQFLDRM